MWVGLKVLGGAVCATSSWDRLNLSKSLRALKLPRHMGSADQNTAADQQKWPTSLYPPLIGPTSSILLKLPPPCLPASFRSQKLALELLQKLLKVYNSPLTSLTISGSGGQKPSSSFPRPTSLHSSDYIPSRAYSSGLSSPIWLP